MFPRAIAVAVLVTAVLHCVVAIYFNDVDLSRRLRDAPRPAVHGVAGRRKARVRERRGVPAR